MPSSRDHPSPLALSEIAIERRILVLRDCKVMIDRDLAELYGVETRTVNQAVRRNPRRFPPDFAFQLTGEEFQDWRSQAVMSNPGDRMGLRHRPWVFTEQGVAMLSAVLTSERAIDVNVEIMRAFVRMRTVLATHLALTSRLDEMEVKYDGQFRAVFDALRQLIAPPDTPRPQIGFHTGSPDTPKPTGRDRRQHGR